MAAAEIQVVNSSNLAKIESFLNDPSYKEIIENSSTFNSRLCAERRMRMPFIDTQTGVAQSHCNLFMTRKQRMPGAREGQVYTYPSQRWRKARRQYLTMSSTRWGWSALDAAENAGDGENSSGIPGDALGGDDSRDGSQTAAKDDPKEWFYDELAIEEMETGEEPDPESDEDYYDDTYANRRKRRGAAPTGPGSRGGRRANKQPDDTPPKRGRAGRGRKRAGQGTLPYEVPGDAEKPYGCELCGAKYKTRPGLTYHFTHTHKEAGGGSAASPSPYCDFCLGDDRENKKTGTPEKLVSCSDCGRSGHPTCLQFTVNMIVSVRKYRWQCIECKCCSVCGTSDNDDQLLFCDDCDRGYHMYCLAPPLDTPPEGSWSCALCINEFHTKR
ncbi:PREDICTED: zinc finger protein ubi-d4-like [Papilio polytes]|uniref:zinc finger protein ubi-d4-like n=1 Tax=Papilio polytes TaxID=76194 RepID=UPI0006764C9D|nr:PREDICTED: zinc finger protein ubi-d4-like [Papilio polytes]